VRHVRMLGLCLVAALALGAYAVSSASALEWGKCENIGSGGNYAGPNCGKSEKAKPKGSGEYEWRKASEVAEKRVAEGKTANVPFTGGNVGSGGVLTTAFRGCKDEANPNEEAIRTTREGCEQKEAEGYQESSQFTEEPLQVECATESNSGETEGKNKVANVNVVFTGCQVFGSIPCWTIGLAEGEIKTSTLIGKLGWINKSAKEVGVVLEPAVKHGLFARFTCAEFLGDAVGVGNKTTGAEFAQGEKYPEGCYGTRAEGCKATPAEEKHGGYDQVISPITPVNQMTSEFTQVYTEEATYPYKNLPSHFEKKHLSALEDYSIYDFWVLVEGQPEERYEGMWSAAGEVITNAVKPEEAGEIKA
jgi:hypothetical protein